MTQERNDPAGADGLGQSSFPADSTSCVSPNPPGGSHHWHPWAGFSREGSLAGMGPASLDFPCLLVGHTSSSCLLGRTLGRSGDAVQHTELRAAGRQQRGQGSPHPVEKGR